MNCEIEKKIKKCLRPGVPLKTKGHSIGEIHTCKLLDAFLNKIYTMNYEINNK